MTRLDGQRRALRAARGALERSWDAAAGTWTDSRAREYEKRHQAELVRAATAFEKAVERLDAEIGQALKRIPR